MIREELFDKVKGALTGLACGGAVGATLEFEKRGTFEPIKDMVGGGPFRLKAGEWEDDMSMALCLANSLVIKRGFDPVDQMNRYCNWYNNGYMSSNGICFDIGNAVENALTRYLESGDPYSGSADAMSSGNGSIMRLAPIPIFFISNYEDCIKYAGDSSKTTHGSEECIESSKLFSSLIFHAFQTKEKEEIFTKNTYRSHAKKVRSIASQRISLAELQSTTGEWVCYRIVGVSTVVLYELINI